MDIRTLNEAGNLHGKYVLLRDDFNVQIVDGKIMDAFRIEQSLPTIRRLVTAGARVAILSHLGRPGGIRNMEFTLAPVAKELSELLGKHVPLISDCIGDAARDACDNMSNGDVILFENVRFHAGEESNDSAFAFELSRGFDIFVNDAFAVSHRAHASTVGVTEFLPSYAGELLESEIKHLSALVENPKRPLLGIIGGAKIKSKIGVIDALAKTCDCLICAGGIGTSIRVAMGMNNIAMNAPNLETTLDEKKQREKILDLMKKYGDKIILPLEKGVGQEFAPNAHRTDKMIADILPTDIVMDEGPASIAEYEHAIDNAKTVVWNGTVGMAEWAPVWSVGTFALARHIAMRTRAGKLESIVGGGDAVAALEATNTKNDMTYVSTGGGVFLEFIEGRKLPGIAVLMPHA